MRHRRTPSRTTAALRSHHRDGHSRERAAGGPVRWRRGAPRSPTRSWRKPCGPDCSPRRRSRPDRRLKPRRSRPSPSCSPSSARTGPSVDLRRHIGAPRTAPGRGSTPSRERLVRGADHEPAGGVRALGAHPRPTTRSDSRGGRTRADRTTLSSGAFAARPRPCARALSGRRSNARRPPPRVVGASARPTSRGPARNLRRAHGRSRASDARSARRSVTHAASPRDSAQRSMKASGNLVPAVPPRYGRHPVRPFRPLDRRGRGTVRCPPGADPDVPGDPRDSRGGRATALVSPTSACLAIRGSSIASSTRVTGSAPTWRRTSSATCAPSARSAI